MRQIWKKLSAFIEAKQLYSTYLSRVHYFKIPGIIFPDILSYNLAVTSLRSRIIVVFPVISRNSQDNFEQEKDRKEVLSMSLQDLSACYKRRNENTPLQIMR